MSYHLILCEGESEVAYIQELNRYLRNNNIENIILSADKIGCGHFIQVKSKFRSIGRDSKNAIIWVDKDIYERNDKKNNDLYLKKPKNIPDFHFNIWNFEDFLMLHRDGKELNEWLKRCEQKGHNKNPLPSEDHCELFRSKFYSKYSKGELPKDFKISQNILRNLITNNKNKECFIKSDFATFLENILSEYL